jgi:hypothetical protein
METWDAWYGKWSAGQAVPPTALSNNLTVGMEIDTFDEYWGQGRMLLCQFQTASTVIPTGTVVTWDNNYIISKLTANAANTAQAVGVVVSNFLSDSTLGVLTAPWNQIQTTNQLYGWIQVTGLTPVLGSAALTAGTLFSSATAGALSSAAGAGKQILGAVTTVATATAWSRFGNATLQGNVYAGRSEIFVNDKGALFPGIGITVTGGTGAVPANSFISDMQTGRNNSFLLNANATATGPVTITPVFTTAGASTFGLAMIERPFNQGQIT